MSDPTPRNAILASPSINRPGEIKRLNAILEDAGLGRPLGPRERCTPAVAVLPVSGDPQPIAAALRRAGIHAETSFPYSVHTVDPDGRYRQSPSTAALHAAGLKSGHGTVTWIPVLAEDMPKAPPWHPTSSAPVVLVLDSGVRKHTWLPQPPEPSYFTVAPPDPDYGLPVADGAQDSGSFGGYWGHATFLAGLIRLAARDVKVLSLRLMSNDGTVNDDELVSALHWLNEKYLEHGGVVDVVLMAFGRPKASCGDDTERLKEAINTLAGRGVKFVASAGNDHSHAETIPSCLDNVVSVGAGKSAADHEPYSNHGPWVDEWRPGTQISLMPLTVGDDEKGNGYALWSGTSFSAAIVAGELAEARAKERAASGGS
jgi:hypothetical protein